MSSARTASAQSDLARPVGLFAEETYAGWVKAALREKQRRPDLAILFDSTIAEPTDLVADILGEHFGSGMSSRFVSVFADGNPFAVAALARRYGYAPNQLITTTGATASLAMTLRTFVAPGDRVLVEQPGFDSLSRLAEEAGAAVRPLVRTAPQFGIDHQALAAELARGPVRAVILTNIHNPSGAWLEAEEIRKVAAALDPCGGLLIVDEVYADFARERVAPAVKAARNIITLSSLTKVFGLFALKFGWIAAAPALIEAIRRQAPDGDIGVSKLSHAVAAHVLEQAEPFEIHWRSKLERTRPVITRHVADLTAEGLLSGDLPDQGCMYFPKVTGVSDTRALARRLAADFGVLVAPGEYFNCPGHVRIGFGGDPEALDLALTRFKAGLQAARRG